MYICCWIKTHTRTHARTHTHTHAHTHTHTHTWQIEYTRSESCKKSVLVKFPSSSWSNNFIHFAASISDISAMMNSFVYKHWMLVKNTSVGFSSWLNYFAGRTYFWHFWFCVESESQPIAHRIKKYIKLYQLIPHKIRHVYTILHVQNTHIFVHLIFWRAHWQDYRGKEHDSS